MQALKSNSERIIVCFNYLPTESKDRELLQHIIRRVYKSFKEKFALFSPLSKLVKQADIKMWVNKIKNVSFSFLFCQERTLWKHLIHFISFCFDRPE